MSGFRFQSRLTQYSDDNGDPLNGGSLTFYVTETSTLSPSYSDISLSTENDNPVSLDADGRTSVDIFLDGTITYRVVLKNSAGVIIAEDDPTSGAAVDSAVSAHNSDTNAHYAASETQRGFIELANQTEVNTGTDTLRAVTPATLSTRLTALTTSINTTIDALVPPGSIIMFGSGTAPTGWLECNGAAISRTTYADLFAVIGETFGAGNGETTFNVPDFRGYFPRGYDDGRGIDNGRAFGSNQKGSLVIADSEETLGVGVPRLDLTSQTATQIEQAVGFDHIDTADYPNCNISQVTGTSETTLAMTSTGGAGAARPINIAILFIIKT